MVDIAVDDTIILAALKTEAFTLDIGGCAWPDLSVLYFLARRTCSRPSRPSPYICLQRPCRQARHMFWLVSCLNHLSYRVLELTWIVVQSSLVGSLYCPALFLSHVTSMAPSISINFKNQWPWPSRESSILVTYLLWDWNGCSGTNCYSGSFLSAGNTVPGRSYLSFQNSVTEKSYPCAVNTVDIAGWGCVYACSTCSYDSFLSTSIEFDEIANILLSQDGELRNGGRDTFDPKYRNWNVV